MKRQILSLITIVFLFTSCGENFLETFPSNAISSEIAISNISDLKNAVNGMYDLLSSYGYYGGTAFYYGDVKGDDHQSRAQNRTRFIQMLHVQPCSQQYGSWLPLGTALVYNPTGM